MSVILERVAYLRGLAEGLELDAGTKEGKLLTKMVEVLQDMGETIADMEENQAYLEDYLDELDENLADVEEEVYGEEEDLLDGDFLEIECPHCKEVIFFDTDELTDGTLICPECQMPIIDDEDEE